MNETRLSCDQQIAYNAICEGKNVFITARAGAGKTYLVNHIIATLDKPYLLCASTGIASTLIGGRTLHSQFLVGYEQDPKESIMRLKQNRRRTRQIRAAKLLIIDEVSMVSDKLLDCIDEICQGVKQRKRPFGGLQVILVGDFLQLPPVFRGANEDGAYCTNSKAWKSAQIVPIMLTSNFRQGNDTKFYDILTRIRYNCINTGTIAALKTRELTPTDDVIRLYSTNDEVDRYNQQMFDKLDAETERQYEMVIWGEQPIVDNFLKNSLFVQELRLRIGARVMLLVNIDKDGKYLCNGSLGTIVDFDMAQNGNPRVKFDNGHECWIGRHTLSQSEREYDDDGEVISSHELLHVEQIPLKLAYAVSIHKSQGQTFDKAYIDCSRAFAPGQVYVALSRVKELNGVYIRGFEPGRSRCDTNMVAWYIELEKEAKKRAFDMLDPYIIV